MRRLLPRRAQDAPKKPRYDVFQVLVSLCKWLEKPYVIVTQAKLLERIAVRTGYPMSRRTLNRHLAGLERASVINRTQRHIRERSGAFKPRATLYTFGQLGVLWIRRMQSDSLIPLGRLRVPFLAQSRKPSLNQRKQRCGQSAHNADGKSSPPRKRGGANGPPVNRRLSAAERAVRGNGKALSREEAQLLSHQPGRKR